MEFRTKDLLNWICEAPCCWPLIMSTWGPGLNSIVHGCSRTKVRNKEVLIWPCGPCLRCWQWPRCKVVVIDSGTCTAWPATSCHYLRGMCDLKGFWVLTLRGFTLVHEAQLLGIHSSISWNRGVRFLPLWPATFTSRLFQGCCGCCSMRLWNQRSKVFEPFNERPSPSVIPKEQSRFIRNILYHIIFQCILPIIDSRIFQMQSCGLRPIPLAFVAPYFWSHAKRNQDLHVLACLPPTLV